MWKPNLHKSGLLSWESLIEVLLSLCALLSVLTTLAIVATLLFETVSFFDRVSVTRFLSDTQWTPLFSEKHFGLLPLLSGTLLIAGIAMLVALPSGLIIAVWMSEYAPSRVRRVLKPCLEILAGIPTVVYGYCALLLVTPFLQAFVPGLTGFNALSPGIVMGIMILPTATSLSEDALRAVPGRLRDAAFALGSTRLQSSFRVVIPAALSGIAASFVLALGRAIGETMIVTIAAGQQARSSLDPFAPVQTMTAYIVQVSLGDTEAGTVEYQTAFVVGMTLFILTLLLNLIAQKLKKRFREAYQ
jgi:phosphate transport system permease protein